MRWLLIGLALTLAGCGPLSNDVDGRTFDQLFDLSIGKFCHEQPETICRANSLELLQDLEDTSGIEQEAVLRHMVDTIDPDSLDNGDVPRMAYAILEAWRQLSFHLR